MEKQTEVCEESEPREGGRPCNHFPASICQEARVSTGSVVPPGTLTRPISQLVRLAFRLAGQIEAGAKGSPVWVAAS